MCTERFNYTVTITFLNYCCLFLSTSIFFSHTVLYSCRGPASLKKKIQLPGNLVNMAF